MKKYTVLLFILSFQIISFAQNYVYCGQKKYESTKTFEFVMNAQTFDKILEVTICKAMDGGGHLLLSTGLPMQNYYIGGTVIVYLSNGQQIYCSDKYIKDYVDNHSLALYYFTKSEVDSLKLYDIRTIRYSILPNSATFSGTFTATSGEEKEVATDIDINKRHFIYTKMMVYLETAKYIKQLFSE